MELGIFYLPLWRFLLWRRGMDVLVALAFLIFAETSAVLGIWLPVRYYPNWAHSSYPFYAWLLTRLVGGLLLAGGLVAGARSVPSARVTRLAFLSRARSLAAPNATHD